jgi:hypothetical protein
MAASALPRPGSKYGPCEDPCQHTDCAETRRMAERNCAGCAEKIGYERAFYRDGEDLIHATCAEDRPANTPTLTRSWRDLVTGTAPRDSPAYRLGTSVSVGGKVPREPEVEDVEKRS